MSKAAELPAIDSGAMQSNDVFRLEGDALSGAKPIDLGAKIGNQPIAQNTGNSTDGADEGAFRAGVTRGLAAALQQKGGSLTIRLSPATLGALKIQMTIGEGQVAVRMETINEQAQQMLMRSMPMLKESLESKGLTVREMQVTPTLHATAAHQGAESRHDAQRDPGGRDGSTEDDSSSGGDRHEGEDARRDQQDAQGDLSEQWFEQRLRMTLNAVA